MGRLTKTIWSAIFIATTAVHAQPTTPSAYLTVDGEVTTPLSLSESDFKTLPRASVKAKDENGHEMIYAGVDLRSC
jgi:hypothetical protein